MISLFLLTALWDVTSQASIQTQEVHIPELETSALVSVLKEVRKEKLDISQSELSIVKQGDALVWISFRKAPHEVNGKTVHYNGSAGCVAYYYDRGKVTHSTCSDR